jgi:hypothetical protein
MNNCQVFLDAVGVKIETKRFWEIFTYLEKFLVVTVGKITQQVVQKRGQVIVADLYLQSRFFSVQYRWCRLTFPENWMY